MIIGVDMDSVLAYIEGPLTDFLNIRFGTNFTIDDKKNYDLSLLYGCTREEMLESIFAFYKSEYMDQIVPVEGSVEGVSELVAKHKLVLITSRPTWIEDKTNLWLERFFPDVFSRIVHTNQVSRSEEQKSKKSDICQVLNVDLFIEDCLDYAHDVLSCGTPVLLYDRPWNQGSFQTGITRVHSWVEIVEQVNAQ